MSSLDSTTLEAALLLLKTEHNRLIDLTKRVEQLEKLRRAELQRGVSREAINAKALYDLGDVEFNGKVTASEIYSGLINAAATIILKQGLRPYQSNLFSLGTDTYLFYDVWTQYLRTVGIYPPALTNLVLGSAALSTSSLNIASYDTAYRTVAQAVNGRIDIPRGGDLTLMATRSLDCYTNSAYLKSRRVTQIPEPTPELGELLQWRNPDDLKTYFIINDVDEGVRKVELV